MVKHQPVMLDEVLAFLQPRRGQIILDCTVGLGGHASRILKEISPGGKLIGIDRDQEALAIAEESLSGIGDYILKKGNLRYFDLYLKELEINQVNAVLFDFGLSSLQLERGERGFSFKNDAPLDMRMDKDLMVCASDLVNNLPQSELEQIIRNFGEERWHRRISRAIVEERKKSPIVSTGQLSQIIFDSVPLRFRHGRIHPATRTFQALRIMVNQELDAIEEALNKLADYLAPGARAVFICFHSLEDRLVKHYLRAEARQGVFRLLTKKVVRPKSEEIAANPRSRSARLRAAEKI